MKKLIVTFALIIASIAVAHADSGWLMVTDQGTRIPMESVGMLVAADDARTFTVVRTAGAGEAISGVKSVSFTFDASSGIDKTDVTGISIIPDPVSSAITLIGCNGCRMYIFDMSGRECMSAIIATDSERIDVSGLAAGIYVLRAGDASVKFIKK